MNLTKKVFEDELKDLDRQLDQQRKRLQVAENVRRDAEITIERIAGARQMVTHLLAKLNLPDPAPPTVPCTIEEHWDEPQAVS